MIDTGWLGLPLLDHVHHCRAEELLAALPDASVSLIATDPPYNVDRVRAWDKWDSVDAFIEWAGGILDEMRRVLKPNGSLYWFAAPQHAWHVEGAIRQRFNVLNVIRWQKDAGWHQKMNKEETRSYLSPWESIVFAEIPGSDSVALGESEYATACDDLRGFVFEPLRAYLDGEREKAGVSFEAVRKMVGCADGSGLPSHWFTRSQWALPTAENYAKLQAGFNRDGGDYLRREYEDLRRPFTVSASVPYTDVWTYPTVQAYAGKHPAEKPLAMMEHIVTASSRTGDIVLDPFAGSGTTLRAAKLHGRRFIGCDFDAAWVAEARQRLDPQFGGHRVAEATSEDAAYADLPMYQLLRAVDAA